MKFYRPIKPANLLRPGDTKTVIKFAWWPTRIEDHIVWLGRYECLYVWGYLEREESGMTDCSDEEWFSFAEQMSLKPYWELKEVKAL